MRLLKKTSSFRFPTDHALRWSSQGLAILCGLIVVFIVLFLVIESLPVLHHVGIFRFFTDSSWTPSSYSQQNQYQLLPMLAASVIVTLGSLCIAAPLGVLSGLFCHLYTFPLAKGYRKAIEILAGIPSVVYGLWGLVVLVPFLQKIHPPGPSLLAGIVVLTPMIFPTIALMSNAALDSIPTSYLQGAASLGLSRWTTCKTVFYPLGKSGIFSGITLALGRAIGETMAILMVCGNVVQFSSTLFDPGRTLTANIALEMAYAEGNHRSALFFCGVVLMAVIIVVMGSTAVLDLDKTKPKSC